MAKQKDIFRDKSSDIRIETNRSGIFKFQIGVDFAKTDPLLDRVLDAHKRFSTVPMLPSIAQQLEKEVIVSSVFGTNTIEGGTLTENEIQELFEDNASIETVIEEKERRVLNIRLAYELADKIAKQESNVVEGMQGVLFELSEELIIDLHKIITNGLAHNTNVPGRYRDNPKGAYTRVGDSSHGGVYTPPKCIEDIQLLMRQFIHWVNSDPILELHPLYRAPLAHYYFERIHPFYDGNGRVGRVIEAILLKCSGMMYAPFGLARSYLENIDQYFIVFNIARKSESKNEDYPNTAFIEFFLHRIREVFDHLHDRVNGLISHIVYENAIDVFKRKKDINDRQYEILHALLSRGYTHDLTNIQNEYWYKALYKNLTKKTRDRDLKQLQELYLIEIKDKRVNLSLP